MKIRLVIAIAILASACSGGGSGGGDAASSNLSNRAPVATGDNAQTIVGTSKLIDVLANDLDPDGDPLTLTNIVQPLNGIAYIDPGITAAPGDDTIIYTPADGFIGQDTISYTVSDNRNGRASGLLTIEVLQPPDPVNTPKADFATTSPNTPINLDVLLNDMWDGSTPLSIATVGTPISGVVSIEDNGTTDPADDYLRYTPSPGFVGTDSFIYGLSTGLRTVVNVLVNPDPSAPAGEIVNGSLVKGPLRGALIRFYAIDPDGNRTGSAIAQTVTDQKGQFAAMLPLPRTDLVAVSSGGTFLDETDSQSDPALRRVIAFGTSQGLSTVVPATANYVAINAYSDALRRQAVRTADPGQFATRYATLRNEFSSAIGFDLISTRPADPDAPDPTTPIASRQYAMALGGIATALNRIALAAGQNAMSFDLASGLVDDLSRCLLDGANESGPVSVLLGGMAFALPDNIDLNREILRFRNNRNSEYLSTPLLKIDRTGCDGAGSSPPPGGNSSPTALNIDIANIDENAPPGTLVGTFSTTDIDPADNHVITLVSGVGDTGNSNFTITGNQLFSSTVFDFESQASYSIRVRTDDMQSLPLERNFIIAINDLNESPTLISLDNSTIAENLPANTVIGTLSVADDSGDTHTYTLTAGPGDTGNAAFSIVGDQLQSNSVFNYEAQSSFSIRVQASDMVNPPVEEVLIISIVDINEAPTAVSLDQTSVNENLSAGTVIGTFTTTDEDLSDTHTYTLVPGPGDTGNGSFSIVGDQLISNVVFNFESQNSYSLRLQSDDSTTTPIVRNFAISIDDINEQPTLISLDTSDLDENLASGTVIGTFTTTDDDPADSHTYMLVPGSGDTGNGSFNIVGNQLVSNAVFDFETQSSFSIRLHSDDSVTTPFERNFIITVNDINEQPTAISLDISDTDENLPSGTVIGTFTTADEDTGDSHTYMLVPGTGDTGNGSFTIVGDQLLSSVVFDFETQSSFSIRLQSDDSATTAIERSFIITVNDVNEQPTAISLDISDIDENIASGTVIGTFTTTDDDPADSHTYMLVPGTGDTGNGSFSIAGDQLVSNAVFDFETQNSFSIRLQSDDSVTTPIERNFTITVNDVNEQPTAISLDISDIDENLPSGTAIGTLTTTDDDPGDSHTYMLIPGTGDTDNGSFNIVGDQLVSNAVFDFETQNSFSIRLQSDDSVNAPIETSFVISVNDVNEQPTAISLDISNIDENVAAGTVIGTFTTTDEDSGDSHTYLLVPGTGDTGNGSFNIVGDQLVSNVVFDFETQSSFSIRLHSDDSATTPIERTFIISINDINEQPTAISLDVSDIDENMAVGTVIGTFMTTDDDPGDSHTYLLVPGTGDTGNGSFNIVGDQLVSNAVFDFETQNSYSIRLRSDDSVTTPIERTFTISINDVNDPPAVNDDTIVTPIDGPVTIDVLVNDSDQDGDPLTIISISSPTPAGGLASINDNATPGDPADDFIDYSPPAGFEGDDTFSYSVSDGTASVPANITVSVSDFGYVASIFPANGAEFVVASQNIDIVFKQPMNASTLDGTTLVLSLSATGVPVLPSSVTYNSGSLTATIDPASDLNAGTVYFVVISDLIENMPGQPQGFPVVTSFTVTPDPTDSDADGLSDFDEAMIGGCLDPNEPDSDFDGIGDGAEVSGGGDPCSDQGQTIYYVDDDGAAGGWPSASTSFGGFSSGSAGNPNYVLIASGNYPDQIDYSANCDYLVFAGSQDPTVPGRIVRNSDGSPTTIVDMGLARNSEFADCTEVRLRDVHMTGGIGNAGKGGGLRVSGTTTALLESVWLTNNNTNDQGGGLGVSNSSVATVRNSVIKDNQVTAGKGGGGVWVGANARLDIENTLVMDNLAIAAGGGGLYFDPLSTGNIVDTYVISNSTSGNGAGIFVLNNDAGKDTVVNVSDSVIAGNLASNDGGGIYINGIGGGASLFDLYHNRIYDNRAAQGAGIMLESTGTIVTVLNNFILGNRAPNGGGGLLINNGAPQLRNNTIIYNQTSQPSGAAITAAGTGNPLIRDSIIWQNRAGGRTLSAAVVANDNYTASISQSDFNLLEVDKIGASDIDFVIDGVTPGFDAGFYLNQLTSPAIDTGSDTALMLSLDMRFTAASGPTDAGTVDRGYHHRFVANYPADGYIENDGVTNNSISVSNLNTSLNPVPVIIRPLTSGLAIGPGHYLVASLEGVNIGMAQLVDQAGVDPLSDGESIILSDLGNGGYRAFIEAESPAASATTIPLRIYIDEQIQPIVFEIDRIP